MSLLGFSSLFQQFLQAILWMLKIENMFSYLLEKNILTKFYVLPSSGFFLINSGVKSFVTSISWSISSSFKDFKEMVLFFHVNYMSHCFQIKADWGMRFLALFLIPLLHDAFHLLTQVNAYWVTKCDDSSNCKNISWWINALWSEENFSTLSVWEFWTL